MRSWLRNAHATGSALAATKRARSAQARCVPAAAADEHQRPPRLPEPRAQRRDCFGPRIHDRRLDADGVVDGGAGDQHVLRQRQYDRTRAARLRDPESARDVFGNAFGAIDLRDPLDAAAVHAAIVDFLEGFAIGEIAADLTDEHDHRRRILRRSMDADRGVRCPRSARHQRDPGPAGQLAVRLGHVRRAAFMPAHDQPQLVARIVQGVEHRQIAFAGNAKSQIDALGKKVRDQDLAAGAWRGHGRRHSRVPGHRMAIPGGHAIFRSARRLS